MPCVTSTLVLHPSTSMLTDGDGMPPVGLGVSVICVVGVSVMGANGVLVNTTGVATPGVGLLTPITTGVGETTTDVCVGGKNGVGGGYPGWKNQPLHDVNGSIIRNTNINFLISSPPYHCIPLEKKIKAP
jgi:hypothetical protein